MLYLGTAPTHASLGHGAHSCFTWARCPLMLHFGTAPTHTSLRHGSLSRFTWARRPRMLHLGTAPLMLHVGTTLTHAQLGRGAQTGVTWTWRPLMPRLGAAPTYATPLGHGPPLPRRPDTARPLMLCSGHGTRLRSTRAWSRRLLMRYLGTAPTRAPFGHGACSHSIGARHPFLLHFGMAPTHASCGGGAHSHSRRVGTALPPASPRLMRARPYPLGHCAHSGCILITAVVVAVTKRNSTSLNSYLHVFIPTNIPLCTSGST